MRAVVSKLVHFWAVPVFSVKVLTVGALHQVDFSALRAAAIAWHEEFAPLPKPLLVVNIGGPTSTIFLQSKSLISIHCKIKFRNFFVLKKGKYEKTRLRSHEIWYYSI